MPIEQPETRELPNKELLDLVIAAQAKVTVLQEERLRLEAHRDKTYKENARLEISLGKLTSDVELLAAKKQEAERNLENVASLLSEAEAKLDAATQTTRSLEKEASGLRASIAEGSARLSEIVVAQRDGLAAVGIEKESLAAQVAAFEERKTRVRDLISSI